MKFQHLVARRQQQNFDHLASSAGQHGSDGLSLNMSQLKNLHQQAGPPVAFMAGQLNQHLLNLHLQHQQHQFQTKLPQSSTNSNQNDDDEQEHEEDDEIVDEEEEDEYNFTNSMQHQQQQAATNLTSGQQHPMNAAAAAAALAANMASSEASAGASDKGSNNGFLVDKNKKLFPQKLWELIHNPSIQHCLRWSQDGQRVYLNRNEFEQYYLKTPNNQFHTQKAISFVRQMNMYGFRKVDDCYYENDNFRRDRKHLLKNMIRRHPNKGLFVGLDHHQLAAAAAAQQALQVNQQLQQLESQDKQRAEQALRLNSYLNSHHHHQAAGLNAHSNQFQSNFAAAAAAAATAAAVVNQQQNHAAHLKPHSAPSPFEQMSSQLAQAAANHFGQQQQQVGENLTTTNGQQQQQQHHHLAQNNSNGSPGALDQQQRQQVITKSPPNQQNQHQPKKSRLLSEFYASTNQHNKLNGAYNDHHQHQAIQQLHNSSAGLDLQTRLQGARGASGLPLSQHLGSESKFAKAAGLRATNFAGPELLESNQSLAAARQAALHETLVRSLLQLKHNQQSGQDFLASLQQQQSQRSLIESLASLSSAGTGSIVDPASNSPTERTATPPSGPPSPSNRYHNHCDTALNLAKSSSASSSKTTTTRATDKVASSSGQADEEDVAIEVDDGSAKKAGGELEEDGVNADRQDDMASNVADQIAGSPLDGTKKVRKFLEDQMSRHGAYEDEHSFDEPNSNGAAIKREYDEYNERDNECDNLEHIKRIKLDESDVKHLAKMLVNQTCSRRGDCRLDGQAVDEASRYTQCFLETLIEDAALISSHSEGEDTTVSTTMDESEKLDARLKKIDSSSLSLALKLIPSKLIAAVQQQASIGR